MTPAEAFRVLAQVAEVHDRYTLSGARVVQEALGVLSRVVTPSPPTDIKEPNDGRQSDDAS